MDALALLSGGMRRRRGRCCVSLLVTVMGLAPAAAAAAPAAAAGKPGGDAAAAQATAGEAKPSAAELAAARRLFHRALAAEDGGRWSEALEMYERVSQVALSPSVHYHMGVCHEALGQLVEAINDFELAASSAEARRDKALVKETRAHLEKLRARTPQLIITVPAGAEGIEIELDGQPINAALVGTALLVNPGERRLTVRSESHTKVHEATLRVSAGDALAVQADLGPKKALPAPPIMPVARPRLPAAPPPEAPSRVPGLAAGGAALALAAGAVVTGVAAYNVREDYLAQNASPTPGSRDAREALKSRGEALAITSTALTGGALVAAGLATYLLWPSSAPADRASARVTPWVGPAGAGLQVGGAL